VGQTGYKLGGLPGSKGSGQWLDILLVSQ